MKKWSKSHSRISLNHRWGQGLLLYIGDGKRMWFLPCQGSWHNRESVWVCTRMDSDFHNAPFIGDTFESGRCAFCKTLFSATEPGLPTGPMAAVYWCRTKSQSSAYIPNQDSSYPRMDRIISPDPLSLTTSILISLWEEWTVQSLGLGLVMWLALAHRMGKNESVAVSLGQLLPLQPGPQDKHA